MVAVTVADEGWKSSWGWWWDDSKAGGDSKLALALALTALVGFGMDRRPWLAEPVACLLDGVALVPAMRCRSDAAGRLSAIAPVGAAGPGVIVALLVGMVGMVGILVAGMMVVAVPVALVALVVVLVVLVVVVVAGAVVATGIGAVVEATMVDGGAILLLLLPVT
ncbi:hypothetical protein RRF57_009077 [Xylaria bambusicola]|uniref:Uncharacterized protein n=1 Tax=Xylaria bambusicola TaxID=326684 RepID=A0AAN7UUD3_9PEZI